MNDVLLTISGNIKPNIQEKIDRGEHPEPDYLAMARGFQSDLIDYGMAQKQAGLFGRLLQKIGGLNLLLAWVCFKQRHNYRVIFTDGEQIGFPLAFLLKFFGGRKRVKHLMIAHILSVGKKKMLLDVLGLQSHIDVFFPYSNWQKRYIEDRWRVPPERVVFTPFMVDTNFYSPHLATPESTSNPFLAGLDRSKPIICSVGLERRDYPTLLTAVNGLDIQVVILAGSFWSKRDDSTQGKDIPANVIQPDSRLSMCELRDLYAMSDFIVMPLYDVDFQAGVTTLLEGMAMGKATICTRVPGQLDVVVEGETGLYVKPGNADDLREKILFLSENGAEAKRLGRNGRRRIEESMSLERYVERLAKFTQSAS